MRVTFWSCGLVSGMGRSESVPTCPDARGSFLRLHIRFPECWDGRRLDSADHKSHMAYAMRSGCPSTHPVEVPQITQIYRYPSQGRRGLLARLGQRVQRTRRLRERVEAGRAAQARGRLPERARPLRARLRQRTARGQRSCPARRFTEPLTDRRYVGATVRLGLASLIVVAATLGLVARAGRLDGCPGDRDALSPRSSRRRRRSSGASSSRASRCAPRPPSAGRCARSSTPPRTGSGSRRSSRRRPLRAPTTTSRCRRSSPTRRRSAATRRPASARSGRTSTRWRRSTSRRGPAGSRAPGRPGTRPASRRGSGWPRPATTSRAATAGCSTSSPRRCAAATGTPARTSASSCAGSTRAATERGRPAEPSS